MMARGCLIAIGTGPGAHDLLTVRAVERLRKVEVILAAASPDNDHSSSLQIASRYLRPDAEIVRLDFPMSRDLEKCRRAWQAAAATTLAILDQGRDAAFLTLGDPLIYSTFAYLMKALRDLAPDIRIEIIPGITSFQAAAARAALSLCEGSECLSVLPGILPENELRERLAQEGAAVILKVYRNYRAIAAALAETGRSGTSLLASHVEQEGEIFGADLSEKPPYMSLIISKKG